MKGTSQLTRRKFERFVLLVSSIGVLTLAILTVRNIGEARMPAYYQISPQPTSTFTPVPSTPTDTPVPPTPTDTPVPPTDTPVPPTDTPVPNSPPVIDAISGPADPVGVGDQPVTVIVDFSDPDIGDTHAVAWDWGDNSDDTQTNAASPASQSHTYAGPGVYTVVVTVTDVAGASDSASYEFIIIFDSAGRFVTGGGWIDSPAGAYKPDNSLTGKATFGFASKYKKGANAPTGNTVFQFKTGDLDFRSETYEWLVVNQGGTNAQFKGQGTVNGTLDRNGNPYKFMIWAGDGSPDTFRIKIWHELSGAEILLYDNGSQHPVVGGSIVIHDNR